MSEFVFAVSAHELSLWIDEHGRIVTSLSVSLEHAGNQINVESIRQLRQTLKVFAGRNLLAQGAVLVKRNRFVLNRVTIEKALGSANQLCAAMRQLR